MAKVEPNPIIQGFTGKLGRDLMFRRLRDGRTILCRKPDFSRREFSDEQLNHQQRFKAAALYAKAAAKIQPIYAEIAAESLKTAYNVALSDWFHPPEILGCDLANWRGQPGDIMRIQAVDDVLVASMRVEFRNEAAAELLVGEATPIDETWWEIVIPSHLTGATQLIVSIEDLAGNVVERSWAVPPIFNR